MNEHSLAKSIDKLAKANADKLLNQIWTKLTECLRPYWRHESANGVLIKEDIINILKKHIDHVHDKQIQIKPSEELLNGCRAKILEDLLKGLPKLRELAVMAGQDEVDEEL